MNDCTRLFTELSPRVGVGVVGAGHWGANHARTLSQIRECKLVGVCDRKLEVAKAVATELNVPCFADLNSFLKTKGLDAVTICTPTHSHYSVASRVIEEKKHLLVEKPMTGSEQDAQHLVQAANSAGLKLMAGLIERFNRAVIAVKQLVDSGAAGQSWRARTLRASSRPTQVFDVGVVKDLAIHDIYVLQFLTDGAVTPIRARTESHNHAYEDYARILVGSKQGITGFLEASWLEDEKVRTLFISGHRAKIFMNYATQQVKVEDSTKTDLSQPYYPPLRLELESFARSIIEDKEPSPSGEEAVETIRLCDQVLKLADNVHDIEILGEIGTAAMHMTGRNENPNGLRPNGL